jgi:hypothetical protein
MTVPSETEWALLSYRPPPFSSEIGPKTVWCYITKLQTNKRSCAPMGLDNKTGWMTDCWSQCDSDCISLNYMALPQWTASHFTYPVLFPLWNLYIEPHLPSASFTLKMATHCTPKCWNSFNIQGNQMPKHEVTHNFHKTMYKCSP